MPDISTENEKDGSFYLVRSQDRERRLAESAAEQEKTLRDWERGVSGSELARVEAEPEASKIVFQ